MTDQTARNIINRHISESLGLDYFQEEDDFLTEEEFDDYVELLETIVEELLSESDDEEIDDVISEVFENNYFNEAKKKSKVELHPDVKKAKGIKGKTKAAAKLIGKAYKKAGKDFVGNQKDNVKQLVNLPKDTIKSNIRDAKRVGRWVKGKVRKKRNTN